MHKKKEFFRLLSAKREIDRYLESMLYHRQKYDEGIENPKFYDAIDIIGYPDGHITLRCFRDGEKAEDFTLPLTEFHEPDDRAVAHMLWHSDYYDGPISGLAEYKGRKVWFHWIKDAPLSELRIFGLYELSDEEIEYEEMWHQYFRDNVGHHCDYVEEKKGDVNYTQESFNKYYEDAKKEPERDYRKNKLIVKLDETFIERGYPKKEVDNEQTS